MYGQLFRLKTVQSPVICTIAHSQSSPIDSQAAEQKLPQILNPSDINSNLVDGLLMFVLTNKTYQCLSWTM